MTPDSRKRWLCRSSLFRALTVITLLLGIGSRGVAQQVPPPIFSTHSPVPYAGIPNPQLGRGTLPERLALVIGIDHYLSEGTLPIDDLANAENDATDVGDALHAAGFFVTYLTGRTQRSHAVTRNDILRAVTDLNNYAARSASRTGRAAVVLVYFAGHGMSIGADQDYLLPSDFSPSVLEDVGQMAISIGELEARLSWGNPTLKIIVADACRTSLPTAFATHSGDVASSPMSLAPIPPAAASGPRLGRDDELLALATLKDGKSSDQSTAAKNGEFAHALLSAMATAAKAAQEPAALGSANTLQQILTNAAKLLDDDSDGFQKSETVTRGTDFVLYPTEADYRLETRAWNNMRASIRRSLAAAPDPIDVSMKDILYCAYSQFLHSSSYYSFYGAAGLEERDRYAGTDKACASDELRTTIKNADSPSFEKPLDGTWVAVVPQKRAESIGSHAIRYAQGDTTATDAGDAAKPVGREKSDTPTVADVLSSSILSPEAKDNVKAFGPSARIADLAVVHGAATLFRDAELVTPSPVTLADNELVQIIGIPKAGGPHRSIKVREPDGTEGYLDQRLVDQAAIAVSFSANVAVRDGLDTVVTYDRESVDPVLRSGVVVARLFQYPSQDKLEGFVKAQAVADHLTTASLSSPSQLPIISPLGPDQSAAADRDRAVKVTMVVLTLDPKIRKRFASVSGLAARVEHAIDLDHVDPAAPASASPEKSGYDAACAEALRTAVDRRGEPETVYVQFGTPGQKAHVERLRQTMQDAGFSVPAAELVTSVPKTNQIRSCLGPGWQPAGGRLAAVLAQCSLGTFKVMPIDSCRKTSRSKTLEVWLGAER